MSMKSHKINLDQKHTTSIVNSKKQSQINQIQLKKNQEQLQMIQQIIQRLINMDTNFYKVSMTLVKMILKIQDNFLYTQNIYIYIYYIKLIVKEQKDIQKNQVTLKENQSKQKLIEIKEYLNNQISNIQKEVQNQLDCVNRIFYTNSQRIDRLKKVWITDEGLSQPSIFDKNTIRVNQFQIRDKPLQSYYQKFNYYIQSESTNLCYIRVAIIHQIMIHKLNLHLNQLIRNNTYFIYLCTDLLDSTIHQGNDLTQCIFKEHKVLEHEKLTIVDGHLYYLEFKNPIKLLPHQNYSVSISTKEQKAFYTYQYSSSHIDHPLIKWQSENLTESDQFIKGHYEHLYSYSDIDQMPAIQVKL